MTTTTLFHRQDKNTPEKMLLERLEIILNKSFHYGNTPSCDETPEDGFSADALDEAYNDGVEDVKEYLRDTLQLYCYERGVCSVCE